LNVATTFELPLTKQEDVVLVRQHVRSQAINIGLSLVDQTKFVTAASELGRNTIVHGGGGKATLELVTSGTKRGIRLTFQDTGKGISDIDRALQDGYTTGGGLGLGLGGAKRLVNEFKIESAVGAGTTVVITQWSLK
jgi:serine/threonine-protein kinase RsbT